MWSTPLNILSCRLFSVQYIFKCYFEYTEKALQSFLNEHWVFNIGHQSLADKEEMLPCMDKF